MTVALLKSMELLGLSLQGSSEAHDLQAKRQLIGKTRNSSHFFGKTRDFHEVTTHDAMKGLTSK
jgi:hypothetical protein